MSDQRALLAAICAHPEEDTPRLAYADWLDDNVGSLPLKKRELTRARAELIRVQCELASLPPEEVDIDTATRRVELEFRQESLLKLAPRRKSWAKPLRPPPTDCPDLVPHPGRFVRGFPHFVSRGEANDLLTAGESLFDICPVHTLYCRNIHGETADTFLAQPWLARVRRLTTTTNIDRSGWIDLPTRHWRSSSDGTDVATTEKLFAAPRLANIEELDLGNWEFGVPGTPVAGRALGGLQRLELHGGVVRGPAAFTRLGELLPTESRLRDLKLSSLRYGADELRELAALPQFQTLQRLSLGLRFGETYPVSPLGTEGVRALTSAPLWRTVWAFYDNMRYGGIRAFEAEVLAASDPAPNLRTLSLPSGELNNAVSALAASPILHSVTTLDMNGSNLRDEGALRLAKSPYLDQLLSLNIARCNVGPKGVKALADAPFAANLVRLNLGGCPIRKGGIDALIAPGAFPRLKRLDACWAAKNTAQKERLRARFGDGVRF